MRQTNLNGAYYPRIFGIFFSTHPLLPFPSFPASVCHMDVDVAVPVPPGSPLQAPPCPAFSSLPARHWVCKSRDCQPGQDGEQNRRHHTAKCPKLLVTQVTPTMQPQSLIWLLALEWALVQKGLSASKLWKYFSIIILIRLNIRESFFKERTVKNWNRLPMAMVESPWLEVFKSHVVVVG